jgi:hypothetical protein
MHGAAHTKMGDYALSPLFLVSILSAGVRKSGHLGAVMKSNQEEFLGSAKSVNRGNHRSVCETTMERRMESSFWTTPASKGPTTR